MSHKPGQANGEERREEGNVGEACPPKQAETAAAQEISREAKSLPRKNERPRPV